MPDTSRDPSLELSRLTGFVPYLRTRSNLPQSPGSRRTLRELPRELHHATTFPCTIQQRHAFYDRPTTLRYLLEALETRRQQAGARENENQRYGTWRIESVGFHFRRPRVRLPVHDRDCLPVNAGHPDDMDCLPVFAGRFGDRDRLPDHASSATFPFFLTTRYMYVSID
ncbi:hypothetical protein Taro_022140 [Colocasia esculenta]|uniref:Uncharacterized protein n=1 Tax=Colocasia esculenta TaxID=4460 RepID=A0A843UTL8_COLES|nr:hypothetical protein [Colocasia esculenta]